MTLSRRSLHALRVADVVLFWPALLLVVVAELATFGAVEAIGVDDKLAHFAGYFALGAMAAAAFEHRRPVVYAVLGLMVLGGGLEIIQPYFGRGRSIWDEVANVAGAFSGALLARSLVEPLRRRVTAAQREGEI